MDKLKQDFYGDHKRLKNSELSELRLDFGAGYRIYYKELDDVIVLVIAGSDKSDQKKTISRANNFLNDYLERNTNDNKPR